MADNSEKRIIAKNSKDFSNLLDISITRREAMCVENRCDGVIKNICDIKLKTQILPITARKLYAYKMMSIRSRFNENQILPIVLRKRALYEKLVIS